MNLPIILPAHSVHVPAGNGMTKIVNEGAVVPDDAIRAIVERAQKLGLIPISIGGMVTGGQTMEIYSNGKRFNPKSGTFETVGLCPDKSDGLLQLPTGGKLQLPVPRNPMPEIKFDAPPFDKPAAPADDEATIDAILEVLCKEHASPAKKLVDKIRRGEVHGLTTSDRVDALREELLSKDEVDLVAERDTLKAEVERLRAESSNHAADAEAIRRERDAAINRAERAERNEAVCHCGSRISDHNPMNDGHGPVEMSEPCQFEQERDTARAAHAEAMELLHQTQECSEGIHFGSDLADAIDAHLAKYGKDASK